MAGTLKPFMGTTPKTEHFSDWYGVKAHWHKIPKYILLALVVLWLLGKI